MERTGFTDFSVRAPFSANMRMEPFSCVFDHFATPYLRVSLRRIGLTFIDRNGAVFKGTSSKGVRNR